MARAGGENKKFYRTRFNRRRKRKPWFSKFFFCGQNLGQLKVFIFRTLALLQSFDFHRAVLPGLGRAQGESYVFSTPI